MNLDVALKKLKTSTTKLGQVKFNKEESTFSAQSLSTFRDATPVEQNLLNLWTGEPNINKELEIALAQCNVNRRDISCLIKLADLLDKVALFPQLRSDAERMLEVIEEKRFDCKYLKAELEKDQQSLYRTDESPTKYSTQKKALSEKEKNYAKQCRAKIKMKNKQISDMKEQIQERSNIRDDLIQLMVAKDEREVMILQEETGILLDEIKEIKRIIEDYEEDYNRGQEPTENKSETENTTDKPSEQTNVDKAFKQLENGINALFITDNNIDQDDTEVSPEDLEALKHELNGISQQLEEQEKDTGLPSRVDEYADRLSMMIKTTISHISHQSQGQDMDEVEKLQQILPEPTTFEFATSQKLKTSILAEVQKGEMSLQDLKTNLKDLGFKEMEIVTTIYKLSTGGFIFVDRDQPVTMVKCIYPFDA